jgi:hypothetical protein
MTFILHAHNILLKLLPDKGMWPYYLLGLFFAHHQNTWYLPVFRVFYPESKTRSVKRWWSRYFDVVFLAAVRKKNVTKNIEGNTEENLVDLEAKSRRFPSIFGCDIFW